MPEIKYEVVNPEAITGPGDYLARIEMFDLSGPTMRIRVIPEGEDCLICSALERSYCPHKPHIIVTAEEKNPTKHRPIEVTEPERFPDDEDEGQEYDFGDEVESEIEADRAREEDDKFRLGAPVEEWPEDDPPPWGGGIPIREHPNNPFHLE